MFYLSHTLLHSVYYPQIKHVTRLWLLPRLFTIVSRLGVVLVLVGRKRSKMKAKIRVVSTKRRARGGWHSLQRVRTLSVLFCTEILVRFQQRPGAQAANGRWAENGRAQIKKWCKVARDVRQRGVKQTGRKQGLRIFSGFVTFPDDSIFFLFAH
jgi:hypothetical protein